MRYFIRRITRMSGSRRRSRSGGCLGRILTIIIFYFGAYLLLRGPITDLPLHISHRGGILNEPENTMASFKDAVAIGTDQLEFDVQRTSDGRLVVIHDTTVDRTTNGTGKVGALTFEEIRSLDAGNGERVPSFEEVILFAKENNVGIFPEAKSPELYPGLAEEMMAVIREYDFVENTTIQSFDPAVLTQIKQLDPDFEVCTLTGLWQFNSSMPEPQNGDAICPLAEMVLVFPWMVRSAHEQGKAVYVYFGELENSIVINILIAFGVDGFMVDDPGMLADVLAP